MPDATASEVLYGYRFWDDAGFPHTGKLKLIGNATPEDVVVGKTFYKDDALLILTGTMTTSGGRKRVYPQKKPEELEPSLLLNAVLLLKEQKRKRGEKVANV